MKKILPIIIIVSLVVGACAGALGSFFLAPYFEKFDWGKAFLANNASGLLNQKTKDCQSGEDSATIDVVKKVSPSVVSIVVTKELDNIYNLTGSDVYEFFGPNYELKQPTAEKQKVGGGTGFVIDASGLILTNRHVVDDLEAEYTVVFNDGSQYEAKVLGRDVIQDIAVLKIEAENLPVVILGDSANLQIGQTVIAIGNAMSEYQNTVTRGVVSGINRRVTASNTSADSEIIEDAIQTDTAINPGNSGGPLLNLAGEVVGINTAINWQGEGLSFAIPINSAKKIVDSVREFGKIIRPWLGVRYIQLDEQIAEKNSLEYDYGALILRGETDLELAVVPGSPADKAGLLENDIILEVAGQKLDGDHTLINELSEFAPGAEISIKVFHNEQIEDLKIILEERQEGY